MLQCAINVSEGRDHAVLSALEESSATTLVDRHSDPSHHRSVFTLLGPRDAVLADAISFTEEALERIDLSTHDGIHPRFGVVDVVPFVPFIPGRTRDTPVSFDEAFDAANRYRSFASSRGLATATYGVGAEPLPDVRRRLRRGETEGLVTGVPTKHHGVTTVGVRDCLVAFNLWVENISLDRLRAVAAALRSPSLRTLALVLDEGQRQLSCNIVRPFELSLSDIVATTRRLFEAGERVTGGELVGLLPEDLLNRSQRREWEFLGVAETSTLEWAYDNASRSIVDEPS